MRSGFSYRHVIGVVAVTVAVILGTSSLPAATVASSAGTTRAAQTHTMSAPVVRITANGRILPPKGGPDVGAELLYAICLSNADNFCLGMLDPGSFILIVVKSYAIARALVEIYKLLSGDKNDKDGDGSGGGGGEKGNGLCLGATGFNKQLELLSCNSPHGVYWQYQQVKGSCESCYRFWNTAYHGWMFTRSDSNNYNAYLGDPVPGNWDTWSFYTANDRA